MIIIVSLLEHHLHKFPAPGKDSHLTERNLFIDFFLGVYMPESPLI